MSFGSCLDAFGCTWQVFEVQQFERWGKLEQKEMQIDGICVDECVAIPGRFETYFILFLRLKALIVKFSECF